jgi:hypothetical protein
MPKLILFDIFPRPEKDHKAHILAFHKLIQEHPEHLSSSDRDGGPLKLALIGGSRNAGDAKRIAAPEELVKQIGMRSVKFNILLCTGFIMTPWSSHMLNSSSTHPIIQCSNGFPGQA